MLVCRQTGAFPAAALRSGTRFHNVEQHLDFPACPIPVDQFKGVIHIGDFSIGQQTPFNRFGAGRAPTSRATRQFAATVFPLLAGSATRSTHICWSTARAFTPWRDVIVNAISPMLVPAVVCCHSFSLSGIQRLWLARINQSAGVPSSWARTIRGIRSVSQSTTYTRRVPDTSVANLRDALVALDPAQAFPRTVKYAELVLFLPCPHPGVDAAQRTTPTRLS